MCPCICVYANASSCVRVYCYVHVRACVRMYGACMHMLACVCSCTRVYEDVRADCPTMCTEQGTIIAPPTATQGRASLPTPPPPSPHGSLFSRYLDLRLEDAGALLHDEVDVAEGHVLGLRL